MRHMKIAVAAAACAAVAVAGGCAMGSLAKTSRYAFSPPLSEVIRANARQAGGRPLAERYSYTWQHVAEELKPGMATGETRIIAVTPVGSMRELASQAERRAADASEQRQIQSELARTAKNEGDARYHLQMARIDADKALANEQLSVDAGRTDASMGVVNAAVGVYSSLAAAGRQLGDQDYGAVSRDVVGDLNAVGAGAMKGSRLHFEYHFGSEPSASKQFDAGLAVMFGTNTEANNSFMVTTVLTLPDGKRISATRLEKMIWYAGGSSSERAFPPGYEEIKIADIPKPAGVSNPLLYYLVLNQLARATIEDIRGRLHARR
jgi:hypothetical protein